MGMVAAGLAIVSGISSIRQGKQAEKDARAAAADTERMARENAAMIEAEAMEEKRRASQENDERAAMARAKAAASGTSTEAGTSMDLFMGAQEEKFSKEMDWLMQSSKSRQKQAIQQGKYQAKSLRNQGRAAKYDYYSSGITSIGKGVIGGMDWWKGR